MSEVKFTKGERKLAADGTPFVYSLTSRGSNRMCFNVSPGWTDDNERTSDEELLAVAQVCRAAPELLAALRRYVNLDKKNGDTSNNLYHTAVAAIAKAEGKQ